MWILLNGIAVDPMDTSVWKHSVRESFRITAISNKIPITETKHCKSYLPCLETKERYAFRVNSYQHEADLTGW
jgi:hypothetical protein